MNLIGVFAAIGCVVGTMLLEGTHPVALLNFPAFLVVVGASFSACMVQFSFGEIASAAKHFF